MALPALNEKQRLLVSVAVIVVGSGILGTVWGLGFRESRALDREVASLRSSLQASEQKLAGLEDLRRRVREGAPEARALALLLPDRPDLEPFLETLPAVEAQAGHTPEGEIDFSILTGKAADEKSSKGKKPVANQPYEETTVELTAAGSWAGFVSFLDGLEHASRLVQVRSFRATEPDKANPLLYKYRILLGIYSLRPPAAAAPPPEAEAGAAAAPPPPAGHLEAAKAIPARRALRSPFQVPLEGGDYVPAAKGKAAPKRLSPKEGQELLAWTTQEVARLENGLETLRGDKAGKELDGLDAKLSAAILPNAQQRDEAQALSARLEALRRRLSIRQTFARLNPRVTFIVCSPQGNSLAVVNRRVLRKGDALAPGISVSEITPQAVTFELQGEHIEVGLR